MIKEAFIEFIKTYGKIIECPQERIEDEDDWMDEMDELYDGFTCAGQWYYVDKNNVYSEDEQFIFAILQEVSKGSVDIDKVFLITKEDLNGK